GLGDAGMRRHVLEELVAVCEPGASEPGIARYLRWHVGAAFGSYVLDSVQFVASGTPSPTILDAKSTDVQLFRLDGREPAGTNGMCIAVQEALGLPEVLGEGFVAGGHWDSIVDDLRDFTLLRRGEPFTLAVEHAADLWQRAPALPAMLTLVWTQVAEE